jgi:hypothetical protein
MPVCPSCSSEFRAGFTRCVTCNVDLVAEDAFSHEAKAFGSPRELLADKECIAIPQVNLQACRELEGVLLAGDIPAYTNAQEADMEVALGSSASILYSVVLASADLDRAKKLMRGRLEAMLEQEGLGQLVTEAVNLDAEEVTCPACGHHGALKNSACASCDLFLGANL